MICRIVRMNHFSLFQLNLRKPSGRRYVAWNETYQRELQAFYMH